MTRAILTTHFRQRVAERLPGVDADTFAKAAAGEIEGMRFDQLRPIGRTPFRNRPSSRLFEFSAPNGRDYTLVVDDMTPGLLKFLTVHTSERAQA